MGFDTKKMRDVGFGAEKMRNVWILAGTRNDDGVVEGEGWRGGGGGVDG